MSFRGSIRELEDESYTRPEPSQGAMGHPIQWTLLCKVVPSGPSAQLSRRGGRGQTCPDPGPALRRTVCRAGHCTGEKRAWWGGGRGMGIFAVDPRRLAPRYAG